MCHSKRDLYLNNVLIVESFYKEDLNKIISNLDKKSVIAYENLASRIYLLKHIQNKEILNNFNKIDKSIIAISSSKEYFNIATIALFDKIPLWLKKLDESILNEKNNLLRLQHFIIIFFSFSLFFLLLFIFLVNRLYYKEANYYKLRYKKLNNAISLLESIMPKLLGEYRENYNVHPRLQKIALLIEDQKEELYKRLQSKDNFFLKESNKLKNEILLKNAESLTNNGKFIRKDIDNKFLSHILNTIKQPILVVDDLALITYVNRAFLLKFSLSYDLIIGKSIQNLQKNISIDFINIISSRIKTVMLSGEPAKYKDIQFVPLKASKGRIFGVTVIFKSNEEHR